MKISEHANYLLNEFGRLQFDYAAYCKPYGESLRNEARNNLEEYIAKLEAANELHRNINHKVAIALGLKSGDSWHDLPKRVIDLCERKDELEMFVDQLVEAGDEMSDQSYWNENKWLALVKGWKERER